MKKLNKIFILLLTLVFTFGIQTNNANAQGFEDGKFYIDLGVGVPKHSYSSLGYTAYGSYNNYNTTRMPRLSMSMKYGFLEYLSGGLYIGMERYGWDYIYPGSSIYAGYEEYSKHSYLTFAVGASFHVWAFLKNTLGKNLGVDRLDLFGTVMAGGYAYTHKRQYVYTKGVITKRTTSGGPYFGGTVGARYYFLDWLGVYLEVGYEAGYEADYSVPPFTFMGGLTFKL